MIYDLGTENTSVKLYGTDENVLAKILYGRYEIFHRGILTHATTYLNGKRIKEIYRERIASKIKKMFNYLAPEIKHITY